jgi:hypothetical protein
VALGLVVLRPRKLSWQGPERLGRAAVGRLRTGQRNLPKLGVAGAGVQGCGGLGPAPGPP